MSSSGVNLEGTFVALKPSTRGQEVNDGVFILASLGAGFGTYEMGVARAGSPPTEGAGANGAWGMAFAVGALLSGQPANTSNGHLFADAMLVRLDTRSYDDSLISVYPGTTGHELDVCVSGLGSSIRNLTGYYVVPILGSGDVPPSGTVDTYKGVWSDTLQGNADAAGLTITNAYGGYFSRPYRAGANVTVLDQWSLFAEIGQRFATDASGGRNHTFTLYDTASTRQKSLRVNGGNNALEILNDSFAAVVASVDDNGFFTAYNAIRPSGGPSGVAGSRIYSGSGAPAAGTGGNGDYYFRNDTPATANQRLYVKSAGAWVGVL